jgi:hypothetical protein
MYFALYALTSSTPIATDALASGSFLRNGAKLRKGADQLERDKAQATGFPARLVLLVPASVRLPAARPCLRPYADHGS